MRSWTVGGAVAARRLSCQVSAMALACALLTSGTFDARAQVAGASGRPNAAAKSPVAEQGMRWSELRPDQQAALKPLEREWAGIDFRSKQKWLQLSSRFPKLTSTERERVQERMSEWTRLTPRERGNARLNFQEAKQLPSEDRQARWKAYEALSPEQKQKLAARAAPPAEVTRRANANAGRAGPERGTAPQAKSNIVPNPAFATPPKAVAPSVVQAGPGATTTLITKRATPPGHQQTGMPKIAATPEFVDKSTLLPQRGPQGAATRAAAAPPAERAPDLR